MRQLLLHYARVKIHNIPNCYWQGLAKYDILRVTQKQVLFQRGLVPGTGGYWRGPAVFLCLFACLRLVSCERARTEEIMGNRMQLAPCRHSALFCRSGS